jgi:hypothetical protein
VLVGVGVLGRFEFDATWASAAVNGRRSPSSLFFMGQILWLEKREYAANRPGMITLVLCATIGVDLRDPARWRPRRGRMHVTAVGLDAPGSGSR